MPRYFANDSAPKIYRGVLLLKEKQYSFAQGRWQLRETYHGNPYDVRYSRENHLTLFPGAVSVETVESGALWQFIITWGNVDPAETILNSTWELDGNQHELRISNHPNALELTKAFPGWTRLIESRIDTHNSSLTQFNEFDYSTIKSANLSDTTGTTIDFTTRGYTAAQIAILDNLAEEYAKLWEKSVEGYLLPRWVIRNTIEVSSNFAFSTSSVLYKNINRMLKPFQMALEPLQSGEVVPAGMIVPGIPWWHKQPFQKSQTAQGTFVINREYWGLESYESFLYDQAVT